MSSVWIVSDPLGPDFDIGKVTPVPETDADLCADIGMTEDEFKTWLAAEMLKAAEETEAEIAEILKNEGNGNGPELSDDSITGWLNV